MPYQRLRLFNVGKIVYLVNDMYNGRTDNQGLRNLMTALKTQIECTELYPKLSLLYDTALREILHCTVS